MPVALPLLAVDPRAALISLVVVASVVSVLAGLVVLLGARRSAAEARRDAAAARADRDRALVERAQAQERADLAHEAHDVLGHRLTLVAVSAGALEVTLQDGADRARAVEVRARAAEAVAGLDDLIASLSAEVAEAPEPVDVVPLVRAVVDRVRRSAVRVDLRVEPHRLVLDATTARTLERVVQEACTNAVKHGTRAPIEVVLTRDAPDVVTVTVDNEVPDGPADGASGGRGLRAAAKRVALVGGELDHGIEQAAQDGTGRRRFRLVARLPVVATGSEAPVTSGGPTSPPRTPGRTTTGGRPARRRRAVALLVGGPLVAVAVGGALAATHVLVVAVASRLDPTRFALVEVGDPATVAEALLPRVQMMDPPRQRPGCVYHEAEVSLFDRDDVFEVCFAADEVSSTSVIAAP